MGRINVTKTFLPPIERYQEYLGNMWKDEYVTNQGPILKDFEKSTKEYLRLNDFHFVSNGTLALQVALKALGITEGEVITTPFSYVATASSILWERCDPVFVDIDRDTLCIDADKIEAAITGRTRAIIPVHVFGNPCDIEKIDGIASKHNLKVIYDAAHAFGVEYNGKSIFDYGDISITSFHATKLFHTVEGGGIFVKDKKVSKKVELIKRFGHDGDDHFMLGMNAKASELHAAMGLCNLEYIDQIIDERKKISNQYDKLLSKNFIKPKSVIGATQNYSYYPIIFNSENALLKTMKALKSDSVYPRRYFYPSLNKLPYLSGKRPCPVSEDISKRILCLPLYAGLKEKDVFRICNIINSCNA